MMHADYPHTPGTLYDCAACEDRCFCEESFGGGDLRRFDTCVYCAIKAEAETSSDLDARHGQDGGVGLSDSSMAWRDE